MKIKDGYLLRQVAGSNIVVPIGEGSIDFSGVITLNEVGAFLWSKLENEITKEQLIEELLSEYAVDKTVAENDISEFISKLEGAGLIE